jgi:hypothetical protein
LFPPHLRTPFQGAGWGEAYASNPSREAVHAVGSVEELLAVLSSVIENEGPPEDLERALDGVARFGQERPVGFDRLTAPLKKRCVKLLANHWPFPFRGFEVRPAFCGLARAWLLGELPGEPDTTINRAGIGAFLATRVREAAEMVVAGKRRELLALPTVRAGWIDPVTFAKRLLTNPAPPRLDLIQSLLRLDRAGRAEALTMAASLTGEIGNAVRHALGAARTTIGPNVALWAAASRSRDPYAADAAAIASHGDSKPDTFRPAEIGITINANRSTIHGKTYTWHQFNLDLRPPLTGKFDVDFPMLLFYQAAHLRNQVVWLDPLQLAVLRWGATVWPGYRESWHAAGCVAIGNNLEWSGAQWGDRAYIEPLLDSETRLTPPALKLTALGLVAKEPTQGTLATDIVIATINDGRMDGGVTQAIISALFEWDFVVLSRASVRLLQVARVSPRHLAILYDGLSRALEHNPPASPSALGVALELLYEMSLLAESEPLSGKLRDFLAGLSGANRAAKMAKRLLLQH